MTTAFNKQSGLIHTLHQATEVAATQTKPAYAGSKPLILLVRVVRQAQRKRDRRTSFL
ncbi:hypothetical protein [Nostoc piscinale]|uniref:hypothetical protein n=1 Tax=Nostoc piscinale TaxID=224012 RepID=UPI0039A4BA74